MFGSTHGIRCAPARRDVRTREDCGVGPTMLIAAGVFAMILTIILGMYWMFIIVPEERDDRTLQTRLKSSRTKAFRSLMIKPQARLSAVAPLNRALTGWQAAIEPVSRTIEQSRLPVTVGTLLLASIFVFLIVMLLVTSETSSQLAGVAVGVGAAFLPLLYVRHVARRRLAAFEQQFPEAADLMARALRAGHAFTTALQMVADEVPDPVGPEFRLLFEQQNYGMSLADALKEFAARIPILDARFFVTAVLTQRETGGNLAEVLDNLASVIRERFKVKRQVRAVTAHGRITGWILACLPPALAFILSLVSPDFMAPLFSDPLGVKMLAVGCTLQVIGMLTIRKLVNIRY